MKLRMTKVLRFWVDVECDDIKDQDPGGLGTEVTAEILRSYEAAGDAMRYLDRKGRVAWKATPRMLTRLADAEREVEDDWAEWL
jgi:hypothetical protein